MTLTKRKVLGIVHIAIFPIMVFLSFILYISSSNTGSVVIAALLCTIGFVCDIAAITSLVVGVLFEIYVHEIHCLAKMSES